MRDLRTSEMVFLLVVVLLICVATFFNTMNFFYALKGAQPVVLGPEHPSILKLDRRTRDYTSYINIDDGSEWIVFNDSAESE